MSAARAAARFADLRADPQRDGSYRNLCAVQAGFRHLLERAMQRKCGKDWFTVVCPKHVFQRLVQRKEWELPIDHLATEYQELMSYADFTDMADIVAGSGGVARVFKRLVATEDDLLRVLDHLERCRRHLALGHRLSDADGAFLSAARSGFDDFVASSKHRQGDESGVAQTAPWDLLPEPDHDTPAEQTTPVSESARESAEEGERAEPERAAEASSTTEEETSAAVEGPPAETWGGDEALARNDRRGVLLALRREIIALAENVYGEPNEHGPALWQLLLQRGWLEEIDSESMRDRLRHFYEIFEDFELHRREGAGLVTLRELADGHKLPALLLELRDEFLQLDRV